MKPAVLLLALALLPPAFPASGAPPNILLILADDVGSDAVGCYGGESYATPNIDALASGGIRFEHGYSMPVCHPSRIALLTGRYPFRFGDAGRKWGSFPEEAESITLAHRMREAGYATAVAGKWQLCLMRDDLDHPRRLGFDHWCLFGWHEGPRYDDPLVYQDGRLRDDTKGRYGPDLYVEFLVDFMKRSRREERPFFAFYSMALCHDVTDDLGGRFVPFHRDGRWMSFAEMVASMDAMIGRLVTALEESGLREETLVLFTTDNGSPSGSYLTVEDGRMVKEPVVSMRRGTAVPGGKGELTDAGTRVPLIANWPGRIAPGQVADDMVDLTDFLPTLAELAALPPDPEPRDGTSFARRLTQGIPSAREWVYAEHRGRRFARTRGWKLHDDGRLFDMTADPNEQSPLPPDANDGAAAGQRERLARILTNLQGPLRRR